MSAFIVLFLWRLIHNTNDAFQSYWRSCTDHGSNRNTHFWMCIHKRNTVTVTMSYICIFQKCCLYLVLLLLHFFLNIHVSGNNMFFFSVCRCLNSSDGAADLHSVMRTTFSISLVWLRISLTHGEARPRAELGCPTPSGELNKMESVLFLMSYSRKTLDQYISIEGEDVLSFYSKMNWGPCLGTKRNKRL